MSGQDSRHIDPTDQAAAARDQDNRHIDTMDEAAAARGQDGARNFDVSDSDDEEEEYRRMEENVRRFEEECRRLGLMKRILKAALEDSRETEEDLRQHYEQLKHLNEEEDLPFNESFKDSPNESFKDSPEEEKRRIKERRLRRREEIVRRFEFLKSVSGDYVDPLDFELYQKALSHGVERDRSLRVNVVGNYNQGKTTLTKLLVGQNTKGIESTNSVEISHCKYIKSQNNVSFRNSSSDDANIHRRIAAVVQNEQHKKKTEITRDTQGVALSKTGGTNIFSESEHSSRSTPKQKTLTPQDVRKISKILRGTCEEDGDLQIWDFGGQYIFYATHTLYHSKESVYLMVFDLTKHISDVIVDPEFPEEFVDKTIQQYAEYWINSIHTYVGSDDGLEPPVILVGTHKDKLEGDENMKEQVKDKYFDNIRKLFEGTTAIKHIHTKDFAIDCTNPHDESIAALREEIVRLGFRSKERVVPARWLPLERALLENKHKKVIPYSDVVDTDSRSEFPLKDKDNIRLFLLHHHNKGNLFYFDEEPISSYVVLDTQYLIDAFRCIVTSERFCKKEPAYRDLWMILRQKARLEMKLIEKVWNEENGFLEHKNVLLMFMQRHYIISEAKSYDDQTESTQGLGWFIVPCFLRDISSNDALEVFLNERQQTQLRFAMSFHISPVVQIVYYRLIAALIGKWSVVLPGQEERVLLYENLGVFRLDRHHVGIVEFHQSIIDLRVVSLCQSSVIKGPVVDKFRRFVVSNVSSEFRKLRHAVTNQEQPFEICFKCNHERHLLEGSKETVSLEQLKEVQVEPCPDLVSGHEIIVRDALSEWYEDYLNIGLRTDCQFDDRQLSKMSQTVGRNWEQLGIELGLNNVQVEHITLDYQTTEMRIFNMLRKWVAVKEEGATVNTLIQAMKATKGISVDWDKVRNIIEEI